MREHSLATQKRGVKGSINDMSNRSGRTPAEMAAECEALVIVDHSYSMEERMCKGGTRYTEANKKLRELQAKYEGKIMVMGFSCEAKFHFDGQIPIPNGSTAMEKALELALPLDEVLDIIIISDGGPQLEDETLAMARKYRGPIYTLFIGDEDDHGAYFMRQLAKQTGDLSEADPDKIFDALEKRVTLLLEAH